LLAACGAKIVPPFTIVDAAYGKLANLADKCRYRVDCLVDLRLGVVVVRRQPHHGVDVAGVELVVLGNRGADIDPAPGERIRDLGCLHAGHSGGDDRTLLTAQIVHRHAVDLGETGAQPGTECGLQSDHSRGLLEDEEGGMWLALLHGGFGLLTVGKSAREAFVLMHHLLEAADIQLRIEATGGEAIEIPDEVCAKTAAQYETHDSGRGSHDWAAYLRMLDKVDTSYRN